MVLRITSYVELQDKRKNKNVQRKINNNLQKIHVQWIKKTFSAILYIKQEKN